MAGRRAHRRQHQPQFRGRRRALDPGGRRRLEGALNDIGQPPLPGLRSPLVESVFEYGSRVGGWRLLRLFRRFGVKVCLLAVAQAAERNPELTRAFVEDGHEIVSHGYRWLDYQTMPEEVEREHVRLGIETIERVAGVRPVGWMTGRPSANTRRLHLELGGFLYDRDSLNDELPYWVTVGGARHLVIPYSFETNDNRFDQNRGFSTGDDFARYMIDCFDTLYAEGAEQPEADVAGAARPADRPARPDHRARPVPRPHRDARPGVDLHRPRHRRALAARPPRLTNPDCSVRVL